MVIEIMTFMIDAYEFQALLGGRHLLPSQYNGSENIIVFLFESTRRPHTSQYLKSESDQMIK
jgi:hypothetical protein